MGAVFCRTFFSWFFPRAVTPSVSKLKRIRFRDRVQVFYFERLPQYDRQVMNKFLLPMGMSRRCFHKQMEPLCRVERDTRAKVRRITCAQIKAMLCSISGCGSTPVEGASALEQDGNMADRSEEDSSVATIRSGWRRSCLRRSPLKGDFAVEEKDNRRMESSSSSASEEIIWPANARTTTEVDSCSDFVVDMGDSCFERGSPVSGEDMLYFATNSTMEEVNSWNNALYTADRSLERSSAVCREETLCSATTGAMAKADSSMDFVIDMSVVDMSDSSDESSAMVSRDSSEALLSHATAATPPMWSSSRYRRTTA